LGNEELPHKLLTQIKLDRITPTGSVQIDDGARYTTSTSVTLSLSSTNAASGVYQVRFSYDGVWDTERWQTPKSTETWTLASEDGEKTVYYQVKDNAGLFSTSYFDRIILDTLAPQGSLLINNGATYTNTVAVNLNLSATDAGSGLIQMRFSNDNSTWSAWEQHTNSKSWSLQDGEGAKSVIVQYRDAAGTVSSYNASTTLDTKAPVADAGPDKKASVGLPVSFDANKSIDETDIIIHKWDFGDRTTGYGPMTNHTYLNPGIYTAVLTVQDAAGNNSTSTATISIQTNQPWIFVYITIGGVVSAALCVIVSRTVKRKVSVARAPSTFLRG